MNLKYYCDDVDTTSTTEYPNNAMQTNTGHMAIRSSFSDIQALGGAHRVDINHTLYSC